MSPRPKLFYAVFAVLLLFFSRVAFAVDVLDVFKFDYETREELQPDGDTFDPALPHGIVSPLTDYISGLARQILSIQKLPEPWKNRLDGLKPGGILLEFISPEEAAEIRDEVLRRNYTGAQFFFRSPASLETILRVFSDRGDYARIVPGMEESRLVASKGNRFDVETVRMTSASVFGMRESRYRTADIAVSFDQGRKALVKVQLLKSPDSAPGSLFFYDSLWYFESDPEGTRGFYLTFSLMTWDYMKTPSFFPLLSGEVRRQVVRHFLDGVAETVLAILAAAEDPRFQNRPLSDLTGEDKKSIGKIIKERGRELRKNRKSPLSIPWSGFLGHRK